VETRPKEVAVDDRTLFRLGSWAAIVGGVIALVGNILHPRHESFDDPMAEQLRIIGETDSWVALHLAILAGFLLVAFGLFALSRSMKGGPAEGIARVALGSLLISTPVAAFALLIDGYALGAIAESAAADPAFAAAASVGAEIGWAGFMGVVIFALGVTPALFGLAVAKDGGYPTWLGWGAFLFGLVSIAAGAWGILDGPSSAFFLVFAISSGYTTLWVIGMGFLLGRRTGGAVTVPEGTSTRTRASAGRS
jgi:hypothetical protein